MKMLMTFLSLLTTSLTALAVNGPAQSMTPETQQFLAKNNLCTLALTQIAKLKFDWERKSALPVVRVGLNLDDVLIALHRNGVNDNQMNELFSAFGKVIQQADHNPVLMDTVRTVFSNEPTYDRVKPVFCMGLSCELKNQATEAAQFPLNYIISPMSDVATVDVKKSLPQLPGGVPHPNGGMSRVEVILLDKIDLNNRDVVDNWVVKFFKDASVYASHALLSEWIAKNNLMARVGQPVEPLFQLYVKVIDNVIFIDPKLYYTFVVSRKYDAQLGAEQIRDEDYDADRVDELNKLAYHEIAAKAGQDAIEKFQLSENDSLLIGQKLGRRFSAFNQQHQVHVFRQGD
jgi:hypothetical protein